MKIFKTIKMIKEGKSFKSAKPALESPIFLVVNIITHIESYRKLSTMIKK